LVRGQQREHLLNVVAIHVVEHPMGDDLPLARTALSIILCYHGADDAALAILSAVVGKSNA
jgi:hypothetical protein